MSSPYSPQRPPINPIRHPAGADPGVRDKRALFLVLITALVPGSAQIVAGSRTLGRMALRVWLTVLVCLVVAGIWFTVSPSAILGLFTQTWSLLLLVVACIALAIGWLWIVIDAWRLAMAGRPQPATGAVTSVCAMVVAALLAGPLVFGAHLLITQRTLIGSVFGGGAAAPPVAGRYNILLIGGDAGEGRRGLRNDTNILVSVDARTGKAVQIGIPRNYENAQFPAKSPMKKVFPNGFMSPEKDRKMNAIYKYGSDNKKLYPGARDAGAEAVKDAVEGITGLTVQYYVIVDMQGFSSMIDALGGVEIDVRKRVPKASILDKKVGSYIEPGRQRLNGEDALWFARSRYNTSDYERMIRQRCVISASVKQLDPATVITKYQGIAKSSPDLITTDIPQKMLGKFGDLALTMRGQGTTNVQLVPPAVNTGNPDHAAVRKMVADAVKASESAPAQPAPGGPPPPGPPGAAPNTGNEPPPEAPDTICVA